MRTLTAILLLAVMALAACSKKPEPVKRHALAGKVVAVRGSEVTVDHKAIPGFMDAMTMAYQVKDTAALKSLAPGDEITADVVVQGTKYWLENVRVTKTGAKKSAG